MKVALFGGTGFVGSYIIDELFKNGHEPVVLVREGSESKLNNSEKCKIISGDVTDVKSIENTIEGSDAVIYCIGIIREFPRKGITFEKLHFQAAKECIDSAKSLGVKRFIMMSANGVKEVVLTGTQLGNYGFDLSDSSLNKLLIKILNETDVPRIRVSSLQPKEVNNEIINTWINDGLGRICPHFHIPLQSGSDRILKDMRRRYSSSEYLDIVFNIKDLMPEASITSDVIVGFPGESDSEFLQTIDVVVKAKLSDVHIFPYSKRPGTTAFYSKSHVEDHVIKERSKDLLSLVDKLSDVAKKSLIGKERSILWEGKSKTAGLTEDYFKVIRKNSKTPIDEISKEKIKGLEDNKIFV